MKPRWMTQHAKDLSEAGIWDALEAAGFMVWDTLPCDLLTYRPDKGFKPIECKSPYNKDGTRRLRKDQRNQEDFLLMTQTPIVLNPLEALKAVGAL